MASVPNDRLVDALKTHAYLNDASMVARFQPPQLTGAFPGAQFPLSEVLDAAVDRIEDLEFRLRQLKRECNMRVDEKL